MTYRRGTILQARLGPSDTTQKGQPFLVVQNDEANNFSPLVIVVPVMIIDRHNVHPFPIMVALSNNESGMGADSVVADCGRILTIHRERVIRILGQASPTTMSKIKSALEISLAL